MGELGEAFAAARDCLALSESGGQRAAYAKALGSVGALGHAWGRGTMCAVPIPTIMGHKGAAARAA